MTIKDIELRSGMTRANIRYYESLGLLSPAREENGYRDYSEAELETLLKIKLLRSLEVSLEDIGALSRGETELDDVLSQQLERLEAKEMELTQARELCSRMRSDKAEYSTLNAAFYLDQMRVRSSAMSCARVSDKPEKVDRPVRRFLARSLDSFIYRCLLNSFLLLCGLNILKLSNGMELFLSILGIAMMLFIEPLLLKTWGTTPGKWIMGLYVRGYGGSKPDYYEGLCRTWNIIRYGYGFFIPIYNLYRLYKSFVACEDLDDLPWEDDCLVCMRDDKPWRWAALAGGYVLCFGVLLLSLIGAVAPPNRGELTVAEFVENYNELAAFNGSGRYLLTESGTFEKKPEIGASYEIELFGAPHPEFHFVEENGVLTGFSITADCEGGDAWPGSYASEISVAVQSFIYPNAGGMFSRDLDPLIDQLNEHPFKNFSFSVRGYTLEAEYEYRGYHPSESMGMLMPDDEQKTHDFSLVFTLSPENG